MDVRGFPVSLEVDKICFVVDDSVVSTSGSVVSTVVVSSGFVVLVGVFLLENMFVFSLVVDEIDKVDVIGFVLKLSISLINVVLPKALFVVVTVVEVI